jgi:hypothetical protein
MFETLETRQLFSVTTPDSLTTDTSSTAVEAKPATAPALDTAFPDTSLGTDHAWGSHQFIMGGSVR